MPIFERIFRRPDLTAWNNKQQSATPHILMLMQSSMTFWDILGHFWRRKHVSLKTIKLYWLGAKECFPNTNKLSITI